MWHHCLRVYSNGDRALEPRDTSEVDNWLEYNKVFRFGCALFVDGKCQYKGYLTQEECDGVEEDLKSRPLEFEQPYLLRRKDNGRAKPFSNK